MRASFIGKAIFLVILFSSTLLHGQQQLWSGIIDPSRAIDWTQVGATISTARTQCTTSACAVVCPGVTTPCGSGGTVTGASLNAALASASPNTFVLMPAGSFTVNTNAQVPSYATLRGAGSNSTFLIFTASSGGAGTSSGCGGHVLCASSSDLNYVGGPSNTANWLGTNGVSGVYTQGATSILLDNISNLTVGNPIVLDQIDDQQDNGAFYIGCERGATQNGDLSPACAPVALISGYSRGSGSIKTIRGQQQIVNVTSISGSGPYTVGITPAIYAPDWRSSQSPGAWWASHPVFAAGFEDFNFNMTNSGGTGIELFNCTGCWVMGVAAVTETSGGTGWHSVGFSICNHCTVRDSYHYGYSGDDYGFANYIGSDNLWENNIGQYPGEGMFSSSDCEGCVGAYDFSVGTLFSLSGTWLEQPEDFHGIQLYALLEGNISAGIYADAFHGTHVNNTFFRNRWDGREMNGTTQTTQNTSVIWSSGSRYNNIIGNIFGTPGYHTNYLARYNASGSTLFSSTIGIGAYPSDGTQDPFALPTSLLWGNWDSVDGATRWCGSSSDTGWSTICHGNSSSITAVSEGAGPTGPPTTGTVSATSTLNPGVGSVVAVTGYTASCAGYNGTFNVTASSTSSFQYTDNTTGLGACGAGIATVGSEVPTALQQVVYESFSNPVPTVGDVGAGQNALPGSFVHASKPAWWPSGKSWPIIGPDVTGGNVGQCSGGTYNSAEIVSSQSSQCSSGGGSFSAVGGGLVVSNPAMDCYYNVMGGTPTGMGSPLPFDAQACYGSLDPPSPPSGLSAVVN